ncbi:hypothetical protein OUZ56_020373 [Daphnia magna]|uniref:Protein kinase domain-containing protein n=1 Tax=Daphnia magna TaxID=35525 RepID=A0ABQ9ZFC5_9CRUS|nr:hypothetical protein OUZ56_020373 [Daphnia magna]
MSSWFWGGKKIQIDRNALLGEGGFGTVFKGEFGGRKVAVKRVELHHVDKREEEAMLKLEHPNIVKLLHCEKDEDFMYYALELCVASLDKLFLKSDNSKKYKGPMQQNIKIFRQLAVGLEYIHSKKLIHRDIKPENVLICVSSTGQGDNITIKWSDFGLATVNEKGLHKGTRTWYAPVLEKLINEERNRKSYTVKSGSSGTRFRYCWIFIEINGELRKYYEDDLLRKMLEHDPKKRKTSKEVVKQLESINNKMLPEKEEELRRLCFRDSSSDLIEKIKDLIQLGIDVNAKGKYEWTYGRNALHLLCEYNSNSNLIDAIRLLIREGIDVNAKDDLFGRNALHLLCGKKSNSNLIDAIRLLIQLGIDVNAKEDIFGRNALHLLCENNALHLSNWLIQSGKECAPFFVSE